jgi:hypothetical protein
VSAQEVVGYRICSSDRCESLVLDVVAHKTGGFCTDCCVKGVREASKTVLVALEGGRYPVSSAKPSQTRRNRIKHLRRKADPRRIEARKAQDKAKRAAMRRLRAFAPELYDLLLADERQKRGLDPFPLETAVLPGSGLDGWETMTAAAFYHALARQETPNDGPQHPRA